jgi:hypothetical protein
MARRRQPATTSGPGVVLLGKLAARLQVVNIACNHRRRPRGCTERASQHGADVPVPAPLTITAAGRHRPQAEQVHDVCGVS